jgi:hypothetical protein
MGRTYRPISPNVVIRIHVTDILLIDSGSCYRSLEKLCNYGLQHLAHNSHPINLLQTALREMNDVNAPKAKQQVRRITYRRLPFEYTQMLRDFVYNEIPVFNVWDAIALIFSISIEDVFCEREAELYCHQLKLISLALKILIGSAADISPQPPRLLGHQFRIATNYL